MVYKCCVKNCKSNLLTTIKKEGNVSVYRFPHKLDDRGRWLAAVPAKTDIAQKFHHYDECLAAGNKEKFPNVFVCRKHWPANMPTFTWRSKVRPIDPPTIFPSDCESSSSPSSPNKRPTQRALSSVRSVQPDELGEFQKKDAIKLEDVASTLATDDNIVTYQLGDELVLQSCSMEHGIPTYMVKLKKDLTFSAFHLGSECSIATLSRNSIKKCNSWSILNEILRYLRNLTVENRKKNALEQLELLGTKKVGKPVYTPEVIVRAFEYYAMSRALYDRFSKDFKLPGKRTLGRITSKTSKKTDATLLNDILSRVEERQRQCVLMLDEVYVKRALLLHGGDLFGRALNNPNELANTILSFMVKCTHGGPEFIAKMLPVTKLDANFQYYQCTSLMDILMKQQAEISNCS